MDRKLVKEIITTETEKFTEEGKIKERVKETKEKIYSEDFTKKELDEAKEEVVEPTTEQSKEELIKTVAEGLDKKNKTEEIQSQQIPAVNINPYQAYLQNQTQVPAPTKFP